MPNIMKQRGDARSDKIVCFDAIPVSKPIEKVTTSEIKVRVLHGAVRTHREGRSPAAGTLDADRDRAENIGLGGSHPRNVAAARLAAT